MKRILTIGLLLTCVSAMHAKVQLPPIFADNMVLQQQTDAALWGYAKPNARQFQGSLFRIYGASFPFLFIPPAMLTGRFNTFSKKALVLLSCPHF